MVLQQCSFLLLEWVLMVLLMTEVLVNFALSHPQMAMPEDGPYYSVNQSYYSDFTNEIKILFHTVWIKKENVEIHRFDGS